MPDAALFRASSDASRLCDAMRAARSPPQFGGEPAICAGSGQSPSSLQIDVSRAANLVSLRRSTSVSKLCEHRRFVYRQKICLEHLNKDRPDRGQGAALQRSSVLLSGLARVIQPHPERGLYNPFDHSFNLLPEMYFEAEPCD
jgi:hypothetical protein